MPHTRFRLSELKTQVRPLRMYWFPRLRSTNDHAITLRKRGQLYAPAMVLTGHQLAGRGRGSNTWWSGPGSITVTFAMPIDPTVEPHQLPLVAGLAVRDAVAELIGDEQTVQLKWPNDLVANDRKLAGLLCERAHKVDLVGVGLNVNVDPAVVPPEIRTRITALSIIAGRELDLTATLVTLSRHVHDRLSRRGERPFAASLKEYDRHHALVGRTVTVVVGGTDGNVTGRCEGLDSVGRLLVRDRTKLHHVISGQVVKWDA